MHCNNQRYMINDHLLKCRGVGAGLSRWPPHTAWHRLAKVVRVWGQGGRLCVVHGGGGCSGPKGAGGWWECSRHAAIFVSTSGFPQTCAVSLNRSSRGFKTNAISWFGIWRCNRDAGSVCLLSRRVTHSVDCACLPFALSVWRGGRYKKTHVLVAAITNGIRYTLMTGLMIVVFLQQNKVDF